MELTLRIWTYGSQRCRRREVTIAERGGGHLLLWQTYGRGRPSAQEGQLPCGDDLYLVVSTIHGAYYPKFNVTRNANTAINGSNTQRT
jgi:hypothetical protein